MTKINPNQPPYEDIIGCQAALFEWAESYDTKDWTRLAQCVAPTLYVDYSAVIGQIWPALPAAEFIAMASAPRFLGNARIRTQHLVGGGAKWIRSSTSDEITGHHQMRVAHQRYKDDAMKEVLYQGHAYGAAKVRYRRVEGVWKFAGIEPDIRWSEYDYDRIFGEE